MVNGKRVIIEACVASVESAIAAERGGADRLELNAALELDGLTPSPGLFEAVRDACSLPIVVMIRPRPYGFRYSKYEYEAMLSDIDLFHGLGADGVALGFLEDDRRIDRARTAKAVVCAGEMETVFHRAFDVTRSLDEALEDLVACGVTRVLTSGGASSAPAGFDHLRTLMLQASGRIEILPGAGISVQNARHLIEATGCTQIHGTFKAPPSSETAPVGLQALLAVPPAGTDEDIVRSIRHELNSTL